MEKVISSAQIIVKQLGGISRLSAIIGAKNFVSSDQGYTLEFKIGKGAKNKINHIKIHHNPMDLYDVTFLRLYNRLDKQLNIKIPEYKKVSHIENVFCDDLMDIIEENIGMFLTLHPRV